MLILARLKLKHGPLNIREMHSLAPIPKDITISMGSFPAAILKRLIYKLLMPFWPTPAGPGSGSRPEWVASTWTLHATPSTSFRAGAPPVPTQI